MFQRSALNKLQAWASQEERKPLILRGARQVGKTTLVEIFAQQYPHFISLNMDLKKDRELFEHDYAVEELVEALFFRQGLPRTEITNTLLFIDEIQSVPQAVAMMRYFYEQVPELAVIAAGSLLETLIDTHISFPVGRVTYLFIFPLSFQEYILALGETEAFHLLQTQPIPNYAHAKLMQLFYQYTLIGGMPEIIKHYIEHHDLVALNRLYQDLLMGYQDDVEKYADSDNMRRVIQHCIRGAPFEMAKRIQFQGFASSNYSSKDIKSALHLLEKAMLIQLIYPTTIYNPPILPHFNRSPRLHFLDTGLVNSSVGLQQHFISLEALSDIYQGRIAEHIVGQELIALGLLPNQNLGFWVKEKKQSSAEVDFVISYQDKLIPIEVKSGKSGRLRSLHQFIDQCPHNLGVRIYAGEFSVEHHKTLSGKPYKLINLPFYLTSQIQEYISMEIE